MTMPISNNPAEDSSVNPQESNFGDLLSQYEQEHKAKADRTDEVPTISGMVVSITPDGVFVDIGKKHEGVLSLEQGKSLKKGDTVQVTAGPLNENGYHKLSLFRVVVPTDYTALEKAFAEKAIVQGTVEESVKGGLRVNIGIRAFLPASRSGARDQGEMDKLIGQEIEVRITKLEIDRDADTADAVVDRRGILEERAAKVKAAALDAVAEGTVVKGTVRNVMDFGAFVDIGGVDGLLHIVDMSWARGARPSDLVKTGDTVEVKILKVDREKRKISLGMKQLQPDPWTVAIASIEPGQRLRGKVARIAEFGAFVELQPGVEGLIHVSEMTWSKKQRRPADIVKQGELVDVVVLRVEPGEKRIALGLKQALGDPWEDIQKRYPKGSVVELPVASMTNFGVFVELADGIEGMIHIGDITAAKRLQHPKDALALGQVVRAQVTDVDNERRRLRLSMKDLEPTSADEYIAEHKVGDVVTGRVIDAGKNAARVELAEGVTALCKIPAPVVAEASGGDAKPAADLGSLTAMLASRWKSGPAAAASAGGDGLRSGQVRQFRISNIDAAHKRIELEVAE